jgi:hypothetical protein
MPNYNTRLTKLETQLTPSRDLPNEFHRFQQQEQRHTHPYTKHHGHCQRLDDATGRLVNCWRKPKIPTRKQAVRMRASSCATCWRPGQCERRTCFETVRRMATASVRCSERGRPLVPELRKRA